MKTNKLWSIMMMLVLVLGTATAFTSCSKDDDDDSVSPNTLNAKSLEGVWVTDSHQLDGRTLKITFKSNGTFEADKLENGMPIGGVYHGSGNWTYGNNILSTSGWWTRTFVVTQFSSTTMTLLDNSDGWTYIFKKK